MRDAAVYRPVTLPELEPALFRSFVRRQMVTQCWRKDAAGNWVLRDAPFIDDWSAQDYETLSVCLRATLRQGGAVFGAFCGGALKGFASVEGTPLPQPGKVLDLTSLHVSQELRGRGIGRTLFLQAADWARAQGADKLYLSGHSAAETQRFYRVLGCVDARFPDPCHTAREPYDCQLEYLLDE